MKVLTHYEVLQISPSASREVVEAAWKVLMRQHHPDKGGNPDTARRINQAHDVLSDPQKRAAYDLELIQARKSKTVRMPRQEERVYPGAYPEAYPPFQPMRVIQDIGETLNEDIQEAVRKANLELLRRMARSNPLLQIFLKQLEENEKKSKRRRA